MRPPHIFQFIATIAMLFLNQAINANPKFINQEGPGLQISSTLMYNEERVPDYQLIIYDENQLTDTIFVAKAKPVFLKLSYGHNYSIRYIKQGFHAANTCYVTSDIYGQVYSYCNDEECTKPTMA